MGDNPLTVLVTGCSSGIGRATALLLAESGYRVLAGVRCRRSVEELTELGVPGLEPLRLDVTSEDDVCRVVEYAQQTCPRGLRGLVNNAGMGLPAAVELSPIDAVRELLEVNTVGPLRMIQQCLPLLRAGRGRVINMSSMNGTMALPMVGAYSASKFALEALSDTLRVELRPWQIPVIVIRPGQVRTSIFAKARDNLSASTREIPEELKDGYVVMYARASEFNERGAQSSTSPEMVARVVKRALEARRPKMHYTVGIDAFGMLLAKSFIPQRVLDRAFARVMRVFKPLPTNEANAHSAARPISRLDPTTASPRP